MVQRLNPSACIKGINFTLMWTTGHNLELHVLCACGFSTENEQSVQCNECNMAKDIETLYGCDGRKAVEHVCFRKSKKLIGKKLGFFVKNVTAQGSQEDIDCTAVITLSNGTTNRKMQYTFTIKNETGATSLAQCFTYTQNHHDQANPVVYNQWGYPVYTPKFGNKKPVNVRFGLPVPMPIQQES